MGGDRSGTMLSPSVRRSLVIRWTMLYGTKRHPVFLGSAAPISREDLVCILPVLSKSWASVSGESLPSEQATVPAARVQRPSLCVCTAF